MARTPRCNEHPCEPVHREERRGLTLQERRNWRIFAAFARRDYPECLQIIEDQIWKCKGLAEYAMYVKGEEFNTCRLLIWRTVVIGCCRCTHQSFRQYQSPLFHGLTTSLRLEKSPKPTMMANEVDSLVEYRRISRIMVKVTHTWGYRERKSMLTSRNSVLKSYTRMNVPFLLCFFSVNPSTIQYCTVDLYDTMTVVKHSG